MIPPFLIGYTESLVSMYSDFVEMVLCAHLEKVSATSGATNRGDDSDQS
jgi:hypothetical protein